MADTQEAIDRDLVVTEGELIAVIVVSILIFILLVVQIALLIYCFCRRRCADKFPCCRDNEKNIEDDRVTTVSEERLIRDEILHSEDEKPEVEHLTEHRPNLLLIQTELDLKDEKKTNDADKVEKIGDGDEDGDKEGDGDGDGDSDGQNGSKDGDDDKNGNGKGDDDKNGDENGEGDRNGDGEENGDLEKAARRLESLLTPGRETVVEPRIDGSRDTNPDVRLLGREDPGFDPGTDNRSNDEQMRKEDVRLQDQELELPDRPEHFPVWSDPGEIRGRGNTRRPITADLTGTPIAPFRFHIHPIGVISAWSDDDPNDKSKKGTLYTSPEEDQGFHEGSVKKDSNEELEGSTDGSGQAGEGGGEGSQLGYKSKDKDRRERGRGGKGRNAKARGPGGSGLADGGKGTGRHPEEIDKGGRERIGPDGSQLGDGGRRDKRRRRNRDPLLDDNNRDGRGQSQLGDEDMDRYGQTPDGSCLVGGGIGIPFGTRDRGKSNREMDGPVKGQGGKSKGKGKKRRGPPEGEGGRDFEDEELESEASTERDQERGDAAGKKKKTREGKQRPGNKLGKDNDGDLENGKGNLDEQDKDAPNDAKVHGKKRMVGRKGASPADKKTGKGKGEDGARSKDGKQRSAKEGEEHHVGDSGISDERDSEESRTNARRPYGDESDVSSLDYLGLNYWPDNMGIFRGWETDTTDDDINITKVEFTANNKLMKSGSLTKSYGSPDRKGDRKRSRSRSKGRGIPRSSLDEEQYDPSEDSITESSDLEASRLGRPPIDEESLGHGGRSAHTHRRHDPRRKKHHRTLHLGRGLPDGAVLEEVEDDEDERERAELRKAYESQLPRKEFYRMAKGREDDRERFRKTGPPKGDENMEGESSSIELESGRFEDMNASGGTTGHHRRGTKQGRTSKGGNSLTGNNADDAEGIPGHKHASLRMKDKRSRSRGRRDATREDNSGRTPDEENDRSIPSTSTTISGRFVVEERRRSGRMRRKERKKRRRSGKKEENKTSWNAYLEHDASGDLMSPLALIFVESDDDYR